MVKRRSLRRRLVVSSSRPTLQPRWRAVALFFFTGWAGNHITSAGARANPSPARVVGRVVSQKARGNWKCPPRPLPRVVGFLLIFLGLRREKTRRTSWGRARSARAAAIARTFIASVVGVGVGRYCTSPYRAR